MLNSCRGRQILVGMRRVLTAVGLLAVSLAAATALTSCGGGGSNAGSNPSDPHVAMGAHLFTQFACSACHGEQGKGDVSSDVPALKDIGNSLSVSQMTAIIN